MYSFPNLGTVCCSTSSSNCCFLIYIQISHEPGKVVWYSHLFRNFPQFVVIHTIKGFSIVNEAEVDVYLEFPCFFCDPMEVGNLITLSYLSFTSFKVQFEHPLIYITDFRSLFPYYGWTLLLSLPNLLLIYQPFLCNMQFSKTFNITQGNIFL